jgi:hypothetical protein
MPRPRNVTSPPPRSWLPRRSRRRSRAGLPPWRPLGVPRGVGGLRYAVVEERVSGTLALRVSAWPGVDEQGRLWFPGGDDEVEVGADVGELWAFLRRHRRVAHLPSAARRAFRAREPELGDVFAVVAKGPGLHRAAETDAIVKPSSWIKPPVFDVTADARQAARQAFYLALTPPLSKAARAEIVAEHLQPERRQ